MSQDVFRIVLENPEGVYYSGDRVSGRVEIELPVELIVKGINLLFKGEAKLQWVEGGGEHRTVYENREVYVENTLTLVSSSFGGGNRVTIPQGRHVYPFTFDLPRNGPSSFEADTGRIRYYLLCKMIVVGGFNRIAKKMVFVLRPLDLNTVPKAKSGDTNEDEKVLCCLCCASPPISATVSVDRIGYVPGEAVMFRAGFKNKSSRTLKKVEARLVMGASYLGHSCNCFTKTKVDYYTLSVIQLKGSSDSGSSDNFYSRRITIPPVPPSTLDGNEIIGIRYYLEIVCCPSGTPFDLHVPVELVIGSIPLQSVAEVNGTSLQALPQPPQLPRVNRDQLEVARLDEVNLLESALGRFKTTKDESEMVAPVYFYYNWSRPNQA